MAARKPEPFRELPAECVPVIDSILAKQKGKWRLNVLEWEDFCQMFRIHICRKYYQFDPERGEFSHWISGVLKRYWINCQRNAGVKHFRPCIANGGCAFALPGNGCRFTASQIQDCSCPLYKKWYDKKFIANNITQTLSLENIKLEIKDTCMDNTNVDRVKSILDRELKTKLNTFEWRVYRCLFILHLNERETALKLGFPLNKKGEPMRRERIKAVNRKIIDLAKKMIVDGELAR